MSIRERVAREIYDWLCAGGDYDFGFDAKSVHQDNCYSAADAALALLAEGEPVAWGPCDLSRQLEEQAHATVWPTQGRWGVYPLYTHPPVTPEPEGELKRKLTAMTKWLEEHHPEVFREGLWDALVLPDTGEQGS